GGPVVFRAQPNAAARFLELRAAEPLAHKLAHQRHPCLPADEDDLVQVLRLDFRVGQRTEAMLTRAQDEVTREAFKFGARQFATKAEVRREERERDFDL